MPTRFNLKKFSTTRCMFSMLLIPVVVLHVVWITPLVEWSCFCPEDGLNHQCCCNCPKCVKNRGGFKSFCHARPQVVDETKIAEGSSIAHVALNHGNALLANDSRCDREPSICRCDSHIKTISLDMKPFLPPASTAAVSSFPVVRVIATDDWRPPEAIPCHPDPPG